MIDKMSSVTGKAEAQHTADDLLVRKMPFQFPDDLDPHWNNNRWEWSHMVSGASLAMPFLEPYLIRTMRKALDKIELIQIEVEDAVMSFTFPKPPPSAQSVAKLENASKSYGKTEIFKGFNFEILKRMNDEP